ncbi:MAG: SusD/RagB family nutrient-binding outer membrane lipoprotein [Bacteroidota bacterium]|nr:SusD/RagB family nutrient-binding outer membrane lipoprotein [Bacteroidota bacterium]
MKKTNSVLIILIMFFYGCNFSSMNVDPNSLTSDVISVEYRLPTFQYLYFSTLGGSIVKRIGNVSGYVTYVNGPVGLNNYIFTPADGSNISLWENLYLAMNSGYQLIERANADKQSHYRGIAKILMASAIGTTTSIYGDVPFSQAFEAAKYQFPIFDSQENIYASIQKMLDEGINDLTNPVEGKKPGSDDLIFKGDVSKWIKVAYGLKARYYLHTIKVNSQAYEQAKSALALSLTSNSDNCFITFEQGQTGNLAPLYLERTGTLETEVDPVFADLLLTLNDPRKDFYAQIKKSLLTGTRAKYGPFYAMANSSFPLLTYEECLFMQTEIEMKTTGKLSAKPIFKNAIQASLERVCKTEVGSSDPSENNLVKALPDSILSKYATSQSNIGLLTDEEVWKKIFQQKYIALFLQSETWNDYRRTEKYISGIAGLPEIKIRSGNQMPRRLQYSSREVSQRLQNIPPDYSIFDRFWWDAKP